MDYSDFDFPPNPTDENDEHGAVPCLNNDIPLQALSSTPVEQLPPTTLPPNQQRPIRQAIQANQKLVMTARTQHRAVAVKKNEGDHDDREQKEEMDEDSEEEENAKKLFGWRKRSRFSWTEEELVDFYKFLSQYGTDFNAIAVLYTDKSRDEVKRLYHRELRRRPADVRAALASRTSIDLATFNTRLKKREEKRQQARNRKLDKEEEETLRQLEAGTLQLLPTSEVATDPGGTANADVEFSFDFKEESHAQKSDMVESLPLPAEGAVGEKEDDKGLVGSPENVLEGTEKTYTDDFIIDCDIISHRLDEIHNIVNEMKVETAEGTHQVLQLRGALRELCSAIHQEFGALKQDKGGQEAAKRRNLQEQGELVTSFPNIKQENHIHSPATQMTTPTIPRHSYGGCSPRATFNGTVPSHKIRKMNSALELVSASIYCVLESVAIRTRAAVALLWIPPPGAVSAELVAPFVVGRDVSRLRNSAPYRVGETSIPCAVSEAGIALNLKPRPGAFDPRASENSPLVDLIETSNAAQLLVPVFTRYGEVQRSVLGVLHLLGTPVIPCPFTQRNEEMAVQTAATLSIIVSSHYEVMGGEWANRIYDPSLLISASAYQGTLDMRSTQKVVDDFAPPPILIYRGVNERKPEDDIREEVKALRNLMTRRPERRAEIYSVKDLQHYATTMEQNWVALLGTITEMENKINKLEENALRTDLPKKQQCMSSSLEQTSNTQSESNGLHSSRCASPSTGALPSLYDARSVIKPEQLNSIEIAAAQKLRALKGDPSIFITEKEV